METPLTTRWLVGARGIGTGALREKPGSVRLVTIGLPGIAAWCAGTGLQDLCTATGARLRGTGLQDLSVALGSSLDKCVDCPAAA